MTPMQAIRADCIAAPRHLERHAASVPAGRTGSLGGGPEIGALRSFFAMAGRSNLETKSVKRNGPPSMKTRARSCKQQAASGGLGTLLLRGWIIGALFGGRYLDFTRVPPAAERGDRCDRQQQRPEHLRELQDKFLSKGRTTRFSFRHFQETNQHPTGSASVDRRECTPIGPASGSRWFAPKSASSHRTW